MTTVESITQRLMFLPQSAQQEVLHFVQFLEQKAKTEATMDENRKWTAFSIDSAMKGMEEERSLYNISDIKESFQ